MRAWWKYINDPIDEEKDPIDEERTNNQGYMTSHGLIMTKN